MEKVCIVGGGASALMCACFSQNKDITIVEKNDKVGKKILATGNGRCNLTNLYMNNHSYNMSIEKYLARFTTNQTLNFYNSIGLMTYADEEGRVYPISNSANSVLDVLRNKISQMKNVNVINSKEVIDVEKTGNVYKVKYSDCSFDIFNKVVIASGNLTNLKMFDKFNIKYKKFIPSLCALTTERHKNLAGVRVKNVNVSCNFKNYQFNEIGEILFKDDGISGIVIFNLSAHMARENNFNKKINIDFAPNIKKDEIINILIERKNSLKKLEIYEFLTGFFHKQLNLELLKKCNLNLDNKVESLTLLQIENLANLIKNYQLTSTSSCDNNQVFSGGICLSELTENLESKNNAGLYFIGETVDVDGVCGGYNLQWAWTSGKIVGESL